MSIATMEEEIGDVNVGLNQALRQQFSRTYHQAYLWISSDLGSYFKTGLLFAGLIWLVTGISEGKKKFCS